MPALLGFFSSTGPLASLFVWIGSKVAMKGIILPIQFALVGALFVAKIAFLTALLTFVMWVFNKIHEIFDYISLEFLSSSSDSVFQLAVSILGAIGFLQALQDVTASFSLVFVSLFALYISKLIVDSLKTISDEFYKIGMLLQQ